ncbi:MAG: type III secretion system chaperone [Pseudomonadota bacterium]
MTLESMLTWLQLPVSAIDGSQAQFRVDERVTVQLELTADGEYLRLRSAVGHSLDTGPSALALDIAIANYAGAATGGGALGLNPVNGEVLLFLEVPCALMDAQTLETVVGRFVEAALHWRDRLEANATAAETDVPDATHQAWVRA